MKLALLKRRKKELIIGGSVAIAASVGLYLATRRAYASQGAIILLADASNVSIGGTVNFSGVSRNPRTNQPESMPLQLYVNGVLTAPNPIDVSDDSGLFNFSLQFNDIGSFAIKVGGKYGFSNEVPIVAFTQPPTQTPPFGLVLQDFGYTGSVGIFRTQYDENYPRYGVRVRHTSGGNLSLICFIVQPGGKIETFRVYNNVPSGTLKEFSFSANLTIPEQVGTWTGYLYATTDSTISTSNYAGKIAQLIGTDVQAIP